MDHCAAGLTVGKKPAKELTEIQKQLLKLLLSKNKHKQLFCRQYAGNHKPLSHTAAHHKQ